MNRLSWLSLVMLMSCCLSVTMGCDNRSNHEASLWVLHNAEGLANIEVYLDERFVVDVAPGERSVPIGTSLGAHTLTFRSSGSTQVLLTHELSELSARSSLVVVRGDESELELLEVSRPLPEVSPKEHALEIVDLSGLMTEFSVLLSGQDEEDFDECQGGLVETFTCHVITLPLPDQ